jgi:hypothetical protein
MNLNKIQKIRETKPVSILDIGIFLTLTILLSVIFLLPKKSGSNIEINMQNKTVESYSLNEERIIEYEDLLTIIIEDGKCFVIHAHCEDKLCEKQGTISRHGETIICMPLGILISITGQDNMNAVTGAQK